MDEKSEVIEMTADIVSAYVGNNSVAAADLPGLIQSIHRALAGITSGSDVQEAAPNGRLPELRDPRIIHSASRELPRRHPIISHSTILVKRLQRFHKLNLKNKITS